MPFEVGNAHGAKARRVERMLERALAQDDGRRLRQGCEAILNLFAQGERWACEFVRDTLDGKPTQRVDVEANVTMSSIGVLAGAIESTILEGQAAASDEE